MFLSKRVHKDPKGISSPGKSLYAGRMQGAQLYRGPVKRSVTIAGHQTSISLEPIFWEALAAAAVADGLPINALIARIDAERISRADPPNLASAVRLWLFARHVNSATHSH